MKKKKINILKKKIIKIKKNSNFVLKVSNVINDKNNKINNKVSMFLNKVKLNFKNNKVKKYFSILFKNKNYLINSVFLKKKKHKLNLFKYFFHNIFFIKKNNKLISDLIINNSLFFFEKNKWLPFYIIYLKYIWNFKNMFFLNKNDNLLNFFFDNKYLKFNKYLILKKNFKYYTNLNNNEFVWNSYQKFLINNNTPFINFLNKNKKNNLFLEKKTIRIFKSNINFVNFFFNIRYLYNKFKFKIFNTSIILKLKNYHNLCNYYKYSYFFFSKIFSFKLNVLTKRNLEKKFDIFNIDRFSINNVDSIGSSDKNLNDTEVFFDNFLNNFYFFQNLKFKNFIKNLYIYLNNYLNFNKLPYKTFYNLKNIKKKYKKKDIKITKYKTIKFKNKKIDYKHKNIVIYYTHMLKFINNYFKIINDKIFFINSNNNSTYFIQNQNTNYHCFKYFYNKNYNKNNFYLNFYKINNFKLILNIFFKPLFLKFFLINNTNFDFLKIINNFIINFYWYSNLNFKNLNNLIKNFNFNYTIEKQIIKFSGYSKFSSNPLIWYNNSLIRFIEHCSGKKVFLKFYMFLDSILTIFDQTRCYVWAQKLKNFKKMFGANFFLLESIQIIYIALKLKDPFFLINWMITAIQKINFWKHRLFFHYIKYLFRYFFLPNFNELGIKGIKFKLKGKISVAGNARKRSIVTTIGYISNATYDNKILYSYDIIRTFTGVMGLQIWLVF